MDSAIEPMRQMQNCAPREAVHGVLSWASHLSCNSTSKSTHQVEHPTDSNAHRHCVTHAERTQEKQWKSSCVRHNPPSPHHT
eukprot:3012640-Amphidinium_carterae.1